MKIAAFVNQFPLLSETFILNQITGLIDRGHAVDIYAYGPGDDPKVHADVERYDLMKRTFYYGAHYQKIPANRAFRLLKGVKLFMINFHKRPAAVLKSLNVLRFGKEALLLTPLYKILPFLELGDYDVVHCHFGPNGVFGSFLRDMGVIRGKIVTSFHGYDMSSHIAARGDSVYSDLFKKGDLFLPISERWKNRLIDLGCAGKKIVVHRMGIETTRFHSSPRKSDTGKVKILTVARLVEKKGVEYGIRAVARVIRENPFIEYTIVGDGDLKDSLNNLIQGLNASGNIRLAGWQRQDEVLESMKQADILLAPSITGRNGDQEGIPVVLMEAMAQGIPVISSYHSGIPELVQDGISGFLVPERDVDGLARKLTHLIEHRHRWPAMGRAGHDFVRRQYDSERLNDRLVRIFEGLVKDKSEGSVRRQTPAAAKCR